MLEQIVLAEKSLFLSLNNVHTPFWDAFMYLISAHYTWGAAVICLILWLFYKKSWREAVLFIVIAVLMLTVADQFVSTLIKPLAERLCPTYHPATKNVVMSVYDDLAGGYSFPSGHATNFFAISMLTALAFRNRIYVFTVFLLASVVAYSRIYLGVHFISDVSVGILLGLLIGWLFFRLYRWIRIRLFRPKQKEPWRIFKPTVPIWTAILSLYIFFMLAFSVEMSRVMERIGFYSC